MKFDFKTGIILVLLVIILLMRLFTPITKTEKEIVTVNGKDYTVIKKVVDTEYIKVPKTVYKPGKIVFHDTPIYVKIPAQLSVDTLAILQNYFNKQPLLDSLVLDDSLGVVTVYDTLSQNKLYSRKWDANINKVKINNTIIVVPEPKMEYYLGGVIGLDKQNIINFAGPTLLIKNKRNQTFSVGAGYSNNKSVTIQGGIYWKL